MIICVSNEPLHCELVLGTRFVINLICQILYASFNYIAETTSKISVNITNVSLSLVYLIKKELYKWLEDPNTLHIAIMVASSLLPVFLLWGVLRSYEITLR